MVVVDLGMILSSIQQDEGIICGQRSAGWTELYTTVTINEASKRKHIFQVFCIFIFHKLDLVLQFFKSQEKNHGSLYDRARNYRNVISINAVSGRKLSCLR